MPHAIEARAVEVLDFWFGRPGEAHHLQPRPEWFRKDPAFDALIAQRFGALIGAALRGELAAWAAWPHSALARIVVLDQFTRNARRDGAGMFAGDALALAAARAMVDAGQDRSLPGVMRQFVYLPFEHAEALAEQQRSLQLFEGLERDEPALAGLLEWARKHHDIVARFGRFPHRNALLGRASTAEELEFLQQPGSSF
ncbi:MAG TPA: DUF924 family protein [Rubrivivax sp.]|nr:DUF924 family protein [Rubrivivax sp.]HPO18222.1 DUF924 family protein [Rubrivivax sp.]